MKQCTSCNEIKPLEHFSLDRRRGYRSRCKACDALYYTANKDILKAKARDRYIPKPRKPRQSKEISRLKKAAYIRNKRQSDSLFRLRSNIGSLIATSLVNAGFKKTSKTADILGCTFKEFTCHIESQFTEGMTWSNRHLWQLDHIVPISRAQTIDQVLLLNHYTNFRPLWAKDNQVKAGKLTDDSLAHPLIEVIKTTM